MNDQLLASRRALWVYCNTTQHRITVELLQQTQYTTLPLLKQCLPPSDVTVKKSFLRGTNLSPGQLILRRLLNPKFHLPCSQGPQLKLVLIHISLVWSYNIFARLVLLSSTHLRLVFKLVFPSYSTTKMLYDFFPYPNFAPYQNKIAFSFAVFYNKTNVKVSVIFNSEPFLSCV